MTAERTPDEIRALEKMGEELVDLRPLIYHVLLKKYKLSHANTEDVYQDICVYMLDKGIKHLDASLPYEPAIMTTTHRRALNHIRDSKRIDTQHYHMLEEREWLSSRDETRDIDACLDIVAIHKELLAFQPMRGRRSYHHLVRHFFDDDLSVRGIARRYGHNANTMHSAKRLIRKIAASLYE